MDQHSFSVQLACDYGMHEAIFIKNFQYWLSYHRANYQHFHKGHYWTYNSVKAFSEMYPYMSEKRIRTTLESLEAQGVIIKGHRIEENGNPYDHTTWYAFADEDKFLPKIQRKVLEKDQQNNLEPNPDRFAENGKSIRRNRQADSPKTANLHYSTDINHTDGEGRKETPPHPVEKKNKEKGRKAVKQSSRPLHPPKPTMHERKDGFLRVILHYKQDHPDKYPNPFYKDFFDYWTEPSQDETAFRKEGEKFFDLSKRLFSFWKKATNAERRGYWDKHHDDLKLTQGKMFDKDGKPSMN